MRGLKALRGIGIIFSHEKASSAASKPHWILKIAGATKVGTNMMFEALVGGQGGKIRQKCVFLLESHKISTKINFWS